MTSETARRLTAARAGAGIGTALQALILAGLAVFYVVEMIEGATDDLTRAATSTVLILVFAVLLAVVARGWHRGADWPRTPTLLWNVLLLPVAWSLYQADRPLVGLGVAALALSTAAASLAVPPRGPIDHDTTDDTRV